MKRLIVVALSLAALVAVVLVLPGLLAERRSAVAEPPATSSLTSASPRTTAPASTRGAASVLSDSFGFVWAPQQGSLGVTVRPETGQSGFELPTQAWRFSACSCAVSPDGTRVAYWSGSTAGAIELRVVEVARPGLGNAIYRPPTEQRGTALAWSSDGSGILFSLEGWPNPGDPVGFVSNTSLLVIEATGGTARRLATGGGVYVPLGWDRAAGIAAAGLSGEGGYTTGYIAVRTNGDPAPRLLGMPEGMGSVQVSTDQRFGFSLFSSDQGPSLRWWRLADPGAMVTGPRLGQTAGQPTWRPLSSQIAWVENGTLQLLDVERGAITSGGAFPTGTPIAFRVDGSAAAAASGPSYVLLDIASGQSAALASSGYIIGSVRFTGAPSNP